MEMAAAPIKQVRRAEFTRHPFTKKKLRVIDSFTPDGVECPVCKNTVIEKVQFVESENPGGVPYHVIWCALVSTVATRQTSCGQQSWNVILRE